LKLKFQTVAEKTAKNFKGLLHFSAPGTSVHYHRHSHSHSPAVLLNSDLPTRLPTPSH